MRTLVLAAAIVLLGSSAYAGPSRGLVLASTADAPAAPTAQAAPAPLAQTPAKPDKAQAIIEQLVKHGVVKMPNQTPPPAPATSASAPAAAVPAAQATTTPAAVRPAAVVQPQPVARTTVEKPKTMSRTESRIRAELRRHGIR